MTCVFCLEEFDPAKEAAIGKNHEIGQTEVLTRCPTCGEMYYAYVDVWTSLTRANRLLEDYKRRNSTDPKADAAASRPTKRSKSKLP